MQSIGITYDGQRVCIAKSKRPRVITLGVGMHQLHSKLLWCDVQLSDWERALFIRNQLKLSQQAYVDYEIVQRVRQRCCLRVYAQQRQEQLQLLKQLMLSYKKITYIETVWHGLARALIQRYGLKDEVFCCFSLRDRQLSLSVHRGSLLLYYRRDSVQDQLPIYAMRRLLACYAVLPESITIQRCFYVGLVCAKKLNLDVPIELITAAASQELIPYGLALRGVDD